jgi:replicative superfamily II helicase
MEWLTESGHLRVLCATSTIAQGINFPVSSIFLASRFVPQGSRSVEMSPREFWNLAGRAGRIGHDSVGVVGIAEGSDKKGIIDFVRRNTGALASRLVTLLKELDEQGKLNKLESVLWQDQWEDFRCYIAHLWAEKKNLETVLAESEQLLRQTFGYTTLRNDPAQRSKADALLNATRHYVRQLSEMPSGTAELADLTGFSPEGVQKAMGGIRNLEEKLVPDDWVPESLFGDAGRMSDLFGVMLKIPQLKQQLEEIGGDGFDHTHLSDITRDWVNGVRLEDIAKAYFTKDNTRSETEAFTNACKAIYRAIVNNGTWGVSALSRVSGMDFGKMTETERRRINALPAMIYHGVRTEDAVLMRMNSAPRSVAEQIGLFYREASGDDDKRYSVGKARTFLKNMSSGDWNRARPDQAALSGADYKKAWEILAGDGS